MFGRGKIFLIFGFVFAIIASAIHYPFAIINFYGGVIEKIFNGGGFSLNPSTFLFFILPLFTFPAAVIVSIKGLVKLRYYKMFCLKAPYNRAFIAIALYLSFYLSTFLAIIIGNPSTDYLFSIIYLGTAFVLLLILSILITIVNKKHGNNSVAFLTRNIFLYPIGTVILLVTIALHTYLLLTSRIIFIEDESFGSTFFISNIVFIASTAFFVIAGIVLTYTLRPSYWEKQFKKHPEYNQMLDNLEKEMSASNQPKAEETKSDDSITEEEDSDEHKYDGLSSEDREIMMIIDKNDEPKVKKKETVNKPQVEEEKPLETVKEAPEVEKKYESPKKVLRFRCSKCKQIFEGKPERCPHCNAKLKW